MPSFPSSSRQSQKRGRFAQSGREALIALALYAGFFIWWYAFAYGLGGGDPKEYTYILGFPAWFFFSCVLSLPLLCLAVWVLVRFFFQDMPLDPYLDPARESSAETSGPSSGAASASAAASENSGSTR